MALAFAVCWSAALLVVAARIPLYSSSTETPTRETIEHHSATLVDVNGSGVLLVVGVPLFATIIVVLALLHRRSRAGAGPIAWTVTGLLAGFNLLAMLSIGPLIVPVTACLVVACAFHEGRPRAEIGHATTSRTTLKFAARGFRR